MHAAPYYADMEAKRNPDSSNTEDETTRLIYEVAKTMGEASSPAPDSDPTVAPSSKTPEQEQGMTFGQIVDLLSPGGDAEALRHLAQHRLEDILRLLPRQPRLPTPDEVPALAAKHGMEPILLEGPVSVADIVGHLGRAAGASSEIMIQIFGDKHVLFVGDEYDVACPEAWTAVEEQANAVTHTHPGPGSQAHHPSAGDLQIAQTLHTPQLILSDRGVVLYPGKDEYEHLPTWEQYRQATPRPDTGNPGVDIDIMLENDRRYFEETLGLQVIPWDELSPGLSLREAVDYAIRTRAERFGGQNTL
jgi:hypothetical protein